MVASGKLVDILGFELKGWEVVVANVTADSRAEIETRARQVTPLADGRFMVDLPPTADPSRLVHELSGRGIELVSINPVRDTLEDYFVQTVAAAAPRQTGGV